MMRYGILKAHRNFLRSAIYFLYEENRVAEAAKWFRYLAERFPDKPIIDGNPESSAQSHAGPIRRRLCAGHPE